MPSYNKSPFKFIIICFSLIGLIYNTINLITQLKLDNNSINTTISEIRLNSSTLFTSELPYKSVWNITWGGISDDIGYNAWSNGYDAIYTCGWSASFGSGQNDILLLKTDTTSGNQIWNRTWGGTSDDQGSSVWGNGLDSIYTCGYTRSFGNGSADIILVKWNATTGAQTWNRTWGGLLWDEGSSVWGDNDSIYTCGYTWSFGAGNPDLVVVKWSATNGTQLWNQTWGGPSDDRGCSIWGENKSIIYTCGYTSSFGKGAYDLLLIKWNATNGAQLWNQTWGGVSWDYGTSIWGDKKDAVYTCGYTNNFGAGGADIVIIKWETTNGNQLWNRTWGGVYDDNGYSIWGDVSGNIYLFGDTTSFGVGGVDMVLVKWNGTTGTQIWNQTWGGALDDYSGSFLCNSANFLYSCGSTNSFGAGSLDIVVIKWTQSEAPTISSSGSIQYIYGELGNFITWLITDTSTAITKYTIYRNNIQITQGAWINNVPISINIDTLSPGNYNYTIIADDGFNGIAQDNVSVIVLERSGDLFNVLIIIIICICIGFFLAIILKWKRQKNKKYKIS